MECESWTIKKTEHWRIDAFELWCWKRFFSVPWTAMRSNQSILNFLNIHWKDWCWIWGSNTLATWWEELSHLKRSWCWKDWRQAEKWITEDEMVGWHHQLDGHEFEQAPAVDWQGSLASCGPRGATSRTQLSNQTELFMTSQNLFKTCHVNLFTI